LLGISRQYRYVVCKCKNGLRVLVINFEPIKNK
jgi:hypothetical protein